MRDIDTAVGIKAKIDAVTGITSLLPGGVHEPPIAGKKEQPYATLAVQKDSRENQLSAGGWEIDFRRADVTVYGTDKATLAAAGAAIDDALREKAITIAGADWMRTEPIADSRGGSIERADKTQDGVHWKVRLGYRIWTSRQGS